MTIPPIKEKLRLKVIGLACGGIFVIGLLFGFVACPAIIRTFLSKGLQLLPGTEVRDMYLRPPIPITFNVYLFNVTNPLDVMKGRKPKLQEVGPFVFEEWKEKFDDVDDESKDTLEFRLRNKFFFKPDATLPLTTEEIIYFPNAIVMAGMIKTIREKPDMIDFVMHGINLIFDSPDTPFLKVKVWDLLVDGIPINCNQSDFAAKIICNILKDQMKDQIEQISKTELRISLLKMKNNTADGKFEVYRGSKNIANVGQVYKYNEEVQLDLYTEDECDKFNGTDGLMFPPFLKNEDTIWAFVYLFCRSLPIQYSQDSEYMSLKTSRLVLEIPGNGPENCYCRDSTNCPFRGTMDMSICMEAPILVSNPHYYNADPDIFRSLEGLNPDKEKHEAYADFHMFTGTPVRGRRRLMFSLDMEPVANYTIMANLPKTPLPLFWLEEIVDVNKTFVDNIKTLEFFQNANTIARWILMSAGLIGFVICLIKYVNASDAKVPVEGKIRF